MVIFKNIILEIIFVPLMIVIGWAWQIFVITPFLACYILHQNIKEWLHERIIRSQNKPK